MAAEVICGNCGHKGEPDRMTKGSFAVEVVLWLCFLVPGMIYTVWRLSTRYDACEKCKSRNLIPLESPRGRELLNQFRADYAEPHGNATKGRIYFAIIALVIIIVIVITAGT